MNNQYNLGDVNTAHLYALSQQGNSSLTHQALTQQATAQAAMRDMHPENNIQVPKVKASILLVTPTRIKQKKDIKQAYKLLSPSKRSIFNPLRWALGESIVMINKLACV